MDAQINEVTSILRSCLITSKNGCPIDQLNREYHMLEGRYIPYRNLGFQTLDAFMKVVPGIRMIRRGVDLWVEAIPTKESAHISRLVANQNKPKLRRRKTKYYRPPLPRRPQPVPLYRGLRSANPVSQNNRVTSLSKPPTPTTPLKVTVYPPKPLMQQNVIPSPSVNLPNNSPTKLRGDVPIQAHQNLDYEKKYRAAMATMPVTVYNPKKPTLEPLQMPMRLQQAAAMTPTTPMTPITPMTPSTPTFSNTTAGGGECPADPRELLERIVRTLKLPAPEYKDVSVHRKNGTRDGIYGQVLIGSQKFSSYPEVAKTETEAEILAARRALIHLKEEVDSKLHRHSTTDKELMKQRILSIVDQHNGVFTQKIPTYYEEQHNENLPKGWVQEIEKWTEVTIDDGVNEARILRRRVSFTETDRAPELRSPTVNKKEVLLMPICPAKPALLELPEEDEWIAFVTVVKNWDEIWVRPFGEIYSEEFDKMTENMIEHYESVRYPISDAVEIGEYYALPEDNYCNRVRVIDYDTTTCEATIFFIDSGEEDTVSVSKLFPLEKSFYWLPAQGIKVSFAGLEEFTDCPNEIDSVMPRIENSLVNGIFCVKVVSRGMEDDVPVASVIFYDTDGPNDYDINENIREMIIQQLVATVPMLEGEKAITEINISHIETNGDVFVQVKHEGMKYLFSTLNKLVNGGLSEDDINRSIVESVDRTRVYLVKCSETGNWYRARVIDIATVMPPLLKAFLIDFGRTITVSPDNVLQLEILSKFLAKYPDQAIKVRLHEIEPSLFDEKMIARLTELAPPSQTLLLKVVRPRNRGESTPTVHLFKRNETDNVLIHINVALALENELSKDDSDGNNNVYKPKKRVDRVNSRPNGEPDDVGKTLKAPRISEIGESFLIHVTMAANPSNFTVQPFKNRAALGAMMSELQEVCLSYTGPHPSLKAIRVGKFYAAPDVKSTWHRVIVSNIINDHMVTVHFCDYGDVTVIPLDKLQPLAKQFFKLPYQAIKARLVGIQPNSMEWSSEDCVRFQELIVNRDLVSIVKESASKKQSPGNTVLGLKLVDVSSPPERIDIDKILVDEGRAKYID